MGGVISLSGNQWGKEATPGTLVAASHIIRSPMFWPEDAREVVRTPEDVAIIGGTTRTHIPFVEAKLVLPETVMTFEQLPIFLSASIKDVVTGVADTGSGKIYTYPLSLLTANTLRTWTIEGFDDNQEYEAGYCFFTEWTMKGASKVPVKLSGNLMGREVLTSTKTPALSLVNVEDALFQKSRFYLDAIGAAFGTTPKTTILGFELNLKTGWQVYYAANGELYFTGHKMGGEKGWVMTGKITIEHDADATAEYSNLKNETARKLRWNVEGTSLGTPGVFSKKTLRYDLPVKFTKYGPIRSQDGNNMATLDFFSAYNETAGVGPEIKVVNEVASI